MISGIFLTQNHKYWNSFLYHLVIAIVS